MNSEFRSIPKLDRVLIPYLRRVLCRFEGVEIESDDSALRTFVLSLPCAGTQVKCLFDLQDLQMLDIGFYGRPKFSDFVVNFYFENTAKSWDAGNLDSLVLVVQRLKKVLLEFYSHRVPVNVTGQIAESFSSDVVEVLGTDDESKRVSFLIRIFGDQSLVQKIKDGQDSDWERCSRFYLDCIFGFDVSTQIPNKIKFKPSFDLGKVMRNVTLKRRLGNLTALSLFLQDFWRNLITQEASKYINLFIRRRLFMAALSAVFGKQVIRMDWSNFKEASLLLRPSTSEAVLVDLKLEPSKQTELNVKIITHGNKNPNEALGAFILKLPNGMSVSETPVQVAQHISQFLVPHLVTLNRDFMNN